MSCPAVVTLSLIGASDTQGGKPSVLARSGIVMAPEPQTIIPVRCRRSRRGFGIPRLYLLLGDPPK